MIPRALLRRRESLAGGVLLCALVVVALGADLLASDLPLAARWHGKTYLLPCVTRPAALATENNVTLRAALAPGDWVLAPPIPWGPEQPDTAVAPLGAPSLRHVLGLDGTGLDVASRLVHGARVSLSVGVVAVSLSVAIGLLLGALAGFYRGAVDAIIARVTEVVLVFPTFFVILTVLGVLEHTTLLAVMVVLGLTRWVDVQRLVRAEVLRLRELEFVHASRALGARSVRTLARHVVPHTLGPVFVAAVFALAGAILVEASLSFLGFGAPPPTASWGSLLTQGFIHAADGAWWLTVFPGSAIFGTVIAINLLGEGLRDGAEGTASRRL